MGFTYMVQSMFIPLEDLINLVVKMHSFHFHPSLDHHDILVRKITYHVHLKKRLLQQVVSPELACVS